MAAYQTVFNIRHSGQESGQALRLSERTHFWYVNRRHRQRPESGACGWETGCAPACFGPRICQTYRRTSPIASCRPERDGTRGVRIQDDDRGRGV